MDEYSVRSKLDLDRRPVPANWEAKWVPNAKRFVYINHSTKTTTWNDPRPVVAKPLADESSHSMFASSLKMDPANELKEQFPDAPMDVIRDCLNTSGQNKMIVSSQLKGMGYSEKSSGFLELKGMGGSASPSGITSTSFDYEKRMKEEAEQRAKAEAERQRKEAAERQRQEAEHRRRNQREAQEKQRKILLAKAEKAHKDKERIRLAKEKREQEEKAKKDAAAKKAAADKKKNTATPAKPKALTAAQKVAIEKRLSRQYKDIPAATINMVLSTFEHDETRAKMVLDGERTKPSDTTAAASNAAPSSSTRTAFVPPPLPTFSSDEPEPLADVGDMSSLLGQKSDFGMPSSGESSGDFFKGLMGDRAKQSVPWTKAKANTSIVSTSSTTRQTMDIPTAMETGDPGMRTPMVVKAVGPNAALVSGPDPGLLDETHLARGRDRSLSRGPLKSLRQGSMYGKRRRDSWRSSLAAGPASLSCGSDPGLHHGPNKDPIRSLMPQMA